MSDRAAPLPTPNPLLVANLVAQIGFGLLAMTICLPSMQEWGSLFGADQSRVQLTFSSYLVAYGSLQLVYGPMSDRFGRKPILMVGLLLPGIGSVLAALATGAALFHGGEVLTCGEVPSTPELRALAQWVDGQSFDGPLACSSVAKRPSASWRARSFFCSPMCWCSPCPWDCSPPPCSSSAGLAPTTSSPPPRPAESASFR